MTATPLNLDNLAPEQVVPDNLQLLSKAQAAAVAEKVEAQMSALKDQRTALQKTLFINACVTVAMGLTTVIFTVIGGLSAQQDHRRNSPDGHAAAKQEAQMQAEHRCARDVDTALDARVQSFKSALRNGENSTLFEQSTSLAQQYNACVTQAMAKYVPPQPTNGYLTVWFGLAGLLAVGGLTMRRIVNADDAKVIAYQGQINKWEQADLTVRAYI